MTLMAVHDAQMDTSDRPVQVNETYRPNTSISCVKIVLKCAILNVTPTPTLVIQDFKYAISRTLEKTYHQSELY